MAVILQKKDDLGPGVSIRDFEVQKDEKRDAEVYERGLEIERSVSRDLREKPASG